MNFNLHYLYVRYKILESMNKLTRRQKTLFGEGEAKNHILVLVIISKVSFEP